MTREGFPVYDLDALEGYEWVTLQDVLQFAFV